MKLTSKFEAEADTSDMFRQLLEAMVDRVRHDFTLKYTAFRDRVYERKTYNDDQLGETFGYTWGKGQMGNGGGAERQAALRFLVIEDISDLANDKNSEVRKAVRTADRILSNAELDQTWADRQPGAAPTAAMKRAKREQEKAYKALAAARLRYANRRWFPIPKTDSDRVIAELVEERIQGLFETFIHKQTGKINDIIKGRAGAVTGTVEDSVWEAYLNFDLVDGTHFEMKMKIKSCVSRCGVPFTQFPTTFHNAHTGSGEKCWASEYALKESL